MWKVRLEKGILNYCLLLITFTGTIKGQGEIRAFVTKHNLQSFTARSSFQRFLIDHNGLMYIASAEGIIQYNGISEQFIKNSDNAGKHIVTCMVEDHRGIIWIACEDGQIFRIFNKELTLWSPQEGLPRHKISKLLVDEKNQIWLATKGEGIYVFNQKYLYHFGKEDGLVQMDINDMTYSASVGILVSSDEGMQILNFENETKKVKKLTLKGVSEKDIIQDIEFYKEHLFVNNLSSGVFDWNLTNDSGRVVWKNKNDEIVLAIQASKEYQIILTDQNVYIKSRTGNEFIPFNSEIEPSEIVCLTLDPSNTLWLLHKNKGLLSVFLPVSQYRIPYKTIQDIALSSDANKLLLCTDAGLQVIQASNGALISSQFDHENLTSVFSDSHKGIYWIGSYGQGLIRYNSITQQSRRYTKKDGLPDNNILQVTGNDQFIWVATLAGILRFDQSDDELILGNLKKYNEENGLPTNFIYQIVPDPDNRIWIGTDGNGLNFVDKDSYCIEKLYNETSTRSIYNLEYSSRGLIYFNASKDGPGYYDIRKNKVVWIETPMKNLESDCITLLNDSVLLTAGTGFLMMANPFKQLSITMDEEFGLTEIIPSLNSMYKDANENVWIGCKNGLIKVEPTVLSVLSRPQNSFLAIKMVNKYVRPEKDSVFNYNENQILFEFNAIHYLASDHLDYRYKLEGYDNDWIYSKEGNQSYSNLSPSHYRFLVQSSINKQYDSTNEIHYSFEVLKPFWLTWWFITICIAVILYAIQSFIKVREANKAKEEAIHRKTAELEFEILKSQVNPHFLFNSFNSVLSLIEDDKDKAIEFTEKLSDYFRNILKYRNLHVISLNEEITILSNYLDLLKVRHPSEIIFDLGNVQPNAWIAPMTLQLLMENAIKHNEISGKHPLRVNVFCEGDFLIFRNSIMLKRTAIDSTGFGLESIQLRYRLLTDKEIRIEKRDETFSVEIPLLYNQI